MSPREEYHTVRLPKGWTPARIMEFAKVVDLLGRLGRLGIENAALRRERRALRKALREAIPFIGYQAHVPAIKAAAEEALKPRKTRRRKA